MNNSKIINELVEDFLEVDNPIPGQHFCCLSFISPEKVLNKKEVYYFTSFLKYITAELKYPDDISPELRDTLPKTKLQELCSSNVSFKNVKDAYDGFILTEEQTLEKQFYEENEFQTTVRGVKVRGVYDTQKEATVRAKLLQKKDKNFHVYVGQVGFWLPWDPNADNVENQEYAEPELNELMKKYNENKDLRDAHYDEERNAKLEEARKKTREKKEQLAENKETNGTDTLKTTGTDTSQSEPIKKINELRNILKDKEGTYRQSMDNNTVNNPANYTANSPDNIMTEEDAWSKQKLSKNAPDNKSQSVEAIQANPELVSKVNVLNIGEHKELMKDLL